MKYIHGHIFLDVTELADAVGYSADYLSSLFKQSMGISIVRYTNLLRIKTAKTLLSNYDITIKEAAFSCGFSDEKYFMKVFKQLEGMTPSQYKNSIIYLLLVGFDVSFGDLLQKLCVFLVGHSRL